MQPVATTIRVSTFRSLRTILIAAILVLSALQIFALGRRTLESLQAYRQTEVTESFDRATNQFITDLFEVLLERLVTNNALRGARTGDRCDAAKH